MQNNLQKLLNNLLRFQLPEQNRALHSKFIPVIDFLNYEALIKGETRVTSFRSNNYIHQPTNDNEENVESKLKAWPECKPQNTFIPFY